ncbi:M3 family oligoendopeptidase [Candidatus Woesearchaeota archaeon]|nr:M3 family oligoendopeptidase [Candidatus Woesearchaeota archaeon]
MTEELQWNLDDVLKVEDFDNLFAEVEKGIGRVDGFYEKMNPQMSEKDFKEYLAFDETLGKKFSRLHSLSGLMKAVDITSEEAKLMESKLTGLQLKYVEVGTKVEHWLIGKESGDKEILDDQNAKRLFSAVPDLEYTLTYSRKAAKFTLSEAEEKIISAKNTLLSSALLNLRGEIETEFKFDFQPEGAEEKTIDTMAELMKYVFSEKPEERKAAYDSLLTKFKDNLDKFFLIYQAVVQDWGHFSTMRGYNSPISKRNFGNHIPDEAIETLLEVCAENKGIFQDYFKFKAKELGMDKLRRCDIYAPLEGKEADKIPFPEAQQMVLETLTQFSESFGEKARAVLDAEHVDSHPREGKQPGAFCCYVNPKTVPYVLLNYIGKTRDVEILAHELGHAIHGLYAKDLPLSSFHANLPLCETASTMAEMVMFEKMFAEAESDEVRKAMLSEKVAGSYATILRQSSFVAFEIKAHEAIQNGVTAEELSDIYFKTLEEQFGDAVEIDPSFRYEWAYIPHIVHTPFYCYAYNFGELLSLALYSKYKEEGESFIPKVEKILSYGGSKDPQEILQEVGIDMCSKDFWQGSFDVIKGWQKQLESYE